ncbi:hypothetical protein ES332_D13G151300v1 [Gossypium tomentosum]|nr:hypothetical protein ES332_D13G151300v1 [Gossypium tomentosum]
MLNSIAIRNWEDSSDNQTQQHSANRKESSRLAEQEVDTSSSKKIYPFLLDWREDWSQVWIILRQAFRGLSNKTSLDQH